MLFVVRHSERADKSMDPAQNARVAFKHDTPITPKGRVMATRAGLKIKELIGDRPEEVRILTSPFWRCIETADAIGEQLGVQELRVHSPACEILTERFFAYDPLEDLMLYKPVVEEYKHTLTLSLTDLSLPYPRYPETRDSFNSRALADITQLVSASQGVIIILVSHGYYCEEFKNFLGKERSNSDFCEINMAERREGGMEMTLWGYTDHASDLYDAES